MDHPIIYKLILATEWESSKKEGIYKGSALDQADGYMHCSTIDQIQGTLEKFFAGQADVVLLTIDTNKIKQHLKWEKSPRSGRVFPHIYGPLPINAVVKVKKRKSLNPKPESQGQGKWQTLRRPWSLSKEGLS